MRGVRRCAGQLVAPVPDVGPASAASRGLLHRVAAELVAQRRDGLHRGGVVLAGGEPGEQRGRDDRHRHRVGDRLLHGPAALAGVGGVAGDLLQARVLLQRLDQQVEQPGADHRAAGPGLEAAVHVGDDVLGGQQLEALGVGLHQAVLDAVVHHLGVVAGADRAGVHEALLAGTLRAQRVEDRHGPLDQLVVAADHQAVAVLQAPHATADAAVDVADAVGGEGLGVDGVVGEPAVAAVDDQVALGQQPAQGLDRLAGRLTGGDHDPDDAGGRQRADQALEAVDVAHLGVVVEPDDLVTGAAQTLAHVAAHLAQADQSELHRRVLRRRSGWEMSACEAHRHQDVTV